MFLLKLLAALVAKFSPPAPEKGSRGDDVIVGGNGRDKIDGRAGDDTLDGAGGDDKVYGGSGNDVIEGGSGNDRVSGGRGDDILSGGTGNDHIDGGRGNDVINGGDGRDLVHAGSGNDTVSGGAGRDFIDGGKGNDVLSGGAGSDHVKGGKGDDTAVYVMGDNAGSRDTYEGGKGVDTLRLDLTQAEWMRADVQRDIRDYLEFIDDHTGRKGEADGKWFTFSAFGLKAKEFENLKIVVDGVEIDPTDQAVTAVNDLFTSAEEDSVVTGNVLANDVVPDLVKTVTLVNGPAVGSLTLNNDGTFAYDPGQAFNHLSAGDTATQTFTYRVTDADGDTDTAVVTIKITGTNDGPVAALDVVANGVEDTALVISAGDLLANDTDADANDTLTIGAVGNPQGGTVALDGNGDVVFTPAPNHSGPASFTYTVVDGAGAQSTATVTFEIEATADQPVLTVQDVTGQAGQPLALDIAAALTDTDGSEILSLTLSGLPAGSLLSAGTANGDGTFTLAPGDLAGLTLTPPTGVSGDVTVQVTATATEQSNGASAAVTAAFVLALPAANQAPSDIALDATSVLENEKGWVVGTLSVTDPDAGDSHTLAVSDARFEIVAGQLKLKDGIALDFEATPTVSVDVTATDAGGLNRTETFVITVDDVPDTVTQGNDLLIGSSGNDVIDGLGGNDTIYGLGGDDLLIGGAGHDSLYGGAGNDELVGGAGNNLLDGGDGDDILRGGNGNNTVLAGAGSDEIYLGDGDNYVDGGDGDDIVEAGEFGNGDNILIGGAGDDDLSAGDGDNRVFAGIGNDVVDLGDGDNEVDGGDGDDEILVGNGNNVIHGGAGNDLIDGLDGDNTIYGDDGDDLVIVDDGDNRIFGGAGNDDLDAGDGDNYIDGGDGDDIIIVGDGNNEIYGGAGDDDIETGYGENYIDAGDGDDFVTLDDGGAIVFGGAGDDDIWAYGGDNVIDAGDGDDIVETGDGDDILTGGLGQDILIGGEGRDVFIYRSADESGVGAALRDVIEDFDAGGAGTSVDILDFSGFVTGVFAFLGDETNAFDGGGNTQARFNDQTKILEIDADGDAQVDMEIELTDTDGAALDDSDFNVT
ncbi:MAG: Ig-like domain-containing protein [Rhodospirillales bacterium]